MKNTIILLLFSLSTYTACSQTLFFDDLNTSTWMSSPEISELLLRSQQQIPLSKLIYSKDSIKKDVSIWSFRDSMLRIVKYDSQNKKDSLIGEYKFSSVMNKVTIHITLSDGSILRFKAGILSSGNYAVLFREKGKNTNAKSRGQVKEYLKEEFGE